MQSMCRLLHAHPDTFVLDRRKTRSIRSEYFEHPSSTGRRHTTQWIGKMFEVWSVYLSQRMGTRLGWQGCVALCKECVMGGHTPGVRRYSCERKRARDNEDTLQAHPVHAPWDSLAPQLRGRMRGQERRGQVRGGKIWIGQADNEGSLGQGRRYTMVQEVDPCIVRRAGAHGRQRSSITFSTEQRHPEHLHQPRCRAGSSEREVCR